MGQKAGRPDSEFTGVIKFFKGDLSATASVIIDPAAGISLLGDGRKTKKFSMGVGDFHIAAGTPAITSVNTGSYAWAFAGDGTEAVQGSFIVPWDWAAATDCTYQIYWTHNTASASGVSFNVTFAPLNVGVANTASTLFTDEVDTATTATSQKKLYLTTATTVGASTEWSAGSMINLYLERDHDDAADTMASDIYVYGVVFSYTADE